MKSPAPVIGLRYGTRATGERYLHGIAATTFEVPAGSRVQLRRLRPDHDSTGPTFAVVFAPPDPRLSPADLAAACRDAAWHRIDPRDCVEGHP